MNGATTVLIALIACLTASLILCDRCCQINSRQLPQYKLVRSNARSTQLILSRRTARDLNECKAFALAKKALAFNYGLETDPSGNVVACDEEGSALYFMELKDIYLGRLKWHALYNEMILSQFRKIQSSSFFSYGRLIRRKRYELSPQPNLYLCRCHEDFLILNMLEWGFNIKSRNAETSRKMCQALQCPEIHNFTTLVRDRNYKYYSIYPGYIATGTTNFTLVCIPRTGVFIFSSNNVNYSQAQISCQKLNASLAHIISEERTNGLAKYISQNTPTFVGLSNRDHKSSWKNEFDEPLSCFNYRAWGEGQPSHSQGCVSLVQPFKSKPGPFWKVVPCGSALPFICEVSPIYKSISNIFMYSRKFK